jgi:hypothetical protein
VAKTLTILLFLKWIIGNQWAFPLSTSKGLRWLFESIWNFGTERFNYFILDAIILKCPALVS